MKKYFGIAGILLLAISISAYAQIGISRVGDVTRYDMTKEREKEKCHALVYISSVPTSTGIFKFEAKDGVVEVSKGKVLTPNAGLFVGWPDGKVPDLAASVIKRVPGKPNSYKVIRADCECTEIYYKAIVLGKGSLALKSGEEQEEVFAKPIKGEIGELRIGSATVTVVKKAIDGGFVETKQYGKIEVILNSSITSPNVYFLVNDKMANLPE